MNVFDLVMAIVFLASNRLLLSLNILRLIRLAGYYSETKQGYMLKEVVDIFKKTARVTLTLIGLVLLVWIFSTMIIHGMLVVCLSTGARIEHRSMQIFDR